ncbi:hypothetical protein NE237_032617 [Protea cynaroides]|uniref:Complex I assembly factor TIMMDC1, mitochondrial n=1 Tax=Protea cynaroides TaxID=273540 RepID=A0A9Q0R3Q5_9MAGN|nr:hypothetical protein NE237_032617 [Protea cynaroides]
MGSKFWSSLTRDLRSGARRAAGRPRVGGPRGGAAERAESPRTERRNLNEEKGRGLPPKRASRQAQEGAAVGSLRSVALSSGLFRHSSQNPEQDFAKNRLQTPCLQVNQRIMKEMEVGADCYIESKFTIQSGLSWSPGFLLTSWLLQQGVENLKYSGGHSGTYFGIMERSSRMAGTVNWGTATVIGVFAGMLYGGSKEAAASVSKDAEVMLKLGSTADKREQHRLMRDAMEKRFIRVTRGSIVGGVRLGMFTAAFCGLQNLLAEKRGVHDIYNIAGAGSATAAAFGLIMPGSLLWRARNVLMGSVLGAAFCFPIGWVHLKLVEKANEENSAINSKFDEGREAKSGVGAAIERLEGSLSK